MFVNIFFVVPLLWIFFKFEKPLFSLARLKLNQTKQRKQGRKQRNLNFGLNVLIFLNCVWSNENKIYFRIKPDCYFYLKLFKKKFNFLNAYNVIQDAIYVYMMTIQTAWKICDRELFGFCQELCQLLNFQSLEHFF